MGDLEAGIIRDEPARLNSPARLARRAAPAGLGAASAGLDRASDCDGARDQPQRGQPMAEPRPAGWPRGAPPSTRPWPAPALGGRPPPAAPGLAGSGSGSVRCPWGALDYPPLGD